MLSVGHYTILLLMHLLCLCTLCLKYLLCLCTLCPGSQLQLLQAMADVQSPAHTKVPLVVLLINGRAATFGRGNTVLDKVFASLLVPSLLHLCSLPIPSLLLPSLPVSHTSSQVDALFVGWRPGEEGGPAFFNLLTGAVNPSARLTQSWPRSVGGIGGPAAPYLYPFQGNHMGEAYAANDGPSTPLFRFGEGV
jgi:beta-glucosidase